MGKKAKTLDPLALWKRIEAAGGLDAYITQQMTRRGLLVERKPTEGMNAKKLAAYKSALATEAEAKRKLQQEAWQAYRQSHILHLGDGIYWTEEPSDDKWDLERAPEWLAENGLPVLDKPEKLAEALKLTLPELRWLAYHREAAKKIHYRRFTIPKRDGRERPIWAPLPKLKAAQRWILREIVEKLPVHGAAHGFLAQRSIATNADVHRDAKIVLKLDLHDFFPTVTWRRVKGIFRKAGYPEGIATLLALLCTEAPREVVEHEGTTYYVALSERCLPQGAPTSPGLTNTLCLRLDQRLSGVAHKLGWRYTRYADDLTFSLPNSHRDQPRLGGLLGQARRVIEAEGFQVRHDKTRILRSGGRQTVTGLVVNGPGPARTSRELQRTLRAALHRLEKGQPLPAGTTLAQLQGYAAYIHMTQPDKGSALLAALAKFAPAETLS